MNESNHLNNTKKDNSSNEETNMNSSIEMIQKGEQSQQQNQKQSKDKISNILIEDYSQEFMVQSFHPNKNIQNKQIDLIKNEYTRKVSSQGEDSSQSGTPQSKNKKKQQRDQDFDLKFKRLGLGSMDISQSDLLESQTQKKKVDGYVDDMQIHLDNSLYGMRGFLDRRYQLLINQLDKVNEKLLVYYEELKNMENKINRDSQIKVMMTQLANYQQFSQSLKKDIELMKVNIKKEEEQALGLYKVYQYRKQQLSDKNKKNLNISKQIIELQNTINNIRRQDDTLLSYHQQVNTSSISDSQNINQSVIQGDNTQKKIINNSNISVNEILQNYKQQDSLNINLNIPGQNIDFNKIQAQTQRIQSLGSIKRGISGNPRQIVQNDPLSKIEAYCGTLKMIKKNNTISQRYLSKNNVNEKNQSPNQESLQQNDQSIISQMIPNNISRSYVTLNQSKSQKYLTRSLQQSLLKNKVPSLLDPVLDNESYELDMINKQIEKYKSKNLTLKNKIISKCNNFFELYQLYEESLQCERKSLEKSQRKVLKDQGLQGSLLFEMQKAELFLTELDMKQKIQKIKFKPNLQDREMRFIVHDTLKSMLDNKQQKHKKEYQKDDFQLDWQPFNQTTPIQIIGLMSLKPQVFEESKQEFEKKARLIKDRISKSKTLAGILETKNQTNTFDFY